jgi:hypothetical protein
MLFMQGYVDALPRRELWLYAATILTDAFVTSPTNEAASHSLGLLLVVLS